MKTQGAAGGHFYWYEHNWHYIRKWDHLKSSNTLYILNDSQEEALEQLADKVFPASDAVMSRCISTAISLLWTEDQIREKGKKIVEIVKKALVSESALK
jgi:8-amino-3,8-dideoxy-alpha-D-manno-octulosonate transaminase